MTRKNHFIPAFTLRNFKNSETDNQISYLIKNNNAIENRNITSLNQYYNIKRFYSLKSLNQIKEECENLLIINPKFTLLDNDLEDNLSSLESKNAPIIDKINHDHNYSPTEDELILLKEFFIIQHLRTRKFKEDFGKYSQEFPTDFEKELIEDIRKSNIDFKELIKHDYPNKNSKERRKLYIDFMRFKKKNPDYRIDSLKNNPYAIKSTVEKFRTMFNKVFNSDESHSIFIINKESRDNFENITKLNERTYSLLVNQTEVPFLLSDSGVLETDDQSTNQQEYFLPISPRFCIAFTKNKAFLQNVDADFVQNFNQFIYEESMFVVFGDSEILETFKRT
ncbi:DUF4238 domain-containing protein [Candidatus Woesearchaeota archaeon]|nr:DUF4238 domain-containing protein [Candidatus Woesearchaeota archaeon]